MADHVIAPREPSAAMVDAGIKAVGAGRAVAAIYRAMIDNAYDDQVVGYFVIFNEPGRVPEKKGPWSKDDHLIAFLRDAMLNDKWTPGFRMTVLQLTWDGDLWASSATEYLSMHDDAIGPRRARAAWRDAREKHERIYRAPPSMKLGTELRTFHAATEIKPHG